MSQVISLGMGIIPPGGAVQTLTGNNGGAVGPDGANNINTIGGNNITASGNPFTNTITFAVTGTNNHNLLVGNATGSINSLGASTDGQLPIGSTGADPVLATLTAGAGISIANAAGSITISADNAGFNWQVVLVNQTAADNQGYFANSGGTLAFQLPGASAVGDTFQVVAMSAAGWSITQLGGQQIRIGNQATTLGAGGSITSTAIGDWITLVCNVANTSWFARAEQGNFTIV